MAQFPFRFSTLIVVLAAALHQPLRRRNQGPLTNPHTAYLAVYFEQKQDKKGKESSKLHDAISRDGFRFTDAVNHDQPVLVIAPQNKNIRDPMILRDPDGRPFISRGLAAGNMRSSSLIQRISSTGRTSALQTWPPLKRT